MITGNCLEPRDSQSDIDETVGRASDCIRYEIFIDSQVLWSRVMGARDMDHRILGNES